MVVLAIVGLLSGVVMLAMPDPRGDLRVDAERFAARIHAARDKAVIEARPVALIVSADGYGFEQRDRGGWQALRDKPFEPRDWSRGASALVGTAGRGRAVFDATGLADPLAVTLVRDGVRLSVTVDADGTIDVAG